MNLADEQGKLRLFVLFTQPSPIRVRDLLSRLLYVVFTCEVVEPAKRGNVDRTVITILKWEFVD